MLCINVSGHWKSWMKNFLGIIYGSLKQVMEVFIFRHILVTWFTPLSYGLGIGRSLESIFLKGKCVNFLKAHCRHASTPGLARYSSGPLPGNFTFWPELTPTCLTIWNVGWMLLLSARRSACLAQVLHQASAWFIIMLCSITLPSGNRPPHLLPDNVLQICKEHFI